MDDTILPEGFYFCNNGLEIFDDNGNVQTLIISPEGTYSITVEEAAVQAIKKLKTLVECYGCVNCAECTKCINCFHCAVCTECYSCYKSVFCNECTSCGMCSYCTECTSCFTCVTCFNSVLCMNSVNSDACKVSQELHDCKHCDNVLYAESSTNCTDAVCLYRCNSVWHTNNKKCLDTTKTVNIS